MSIRFEALNHMLGHCPEILTFFPKALDQVIHHRVSELTWEVCWTVIHNDMLLNQIERKLDFLLLEKLWLNLSWLLLLRLSNPSKYFPKIFLVSGAMRKIIDTCDCLNFLVYEDCFFVWACILHAGRACASLFFIWIFEILEKFFSLIP